VDLDELRAKVDEIDRKLVELLNDRAELVLEIGKLKKTTTEEAYQPHREKEVYDKVVALNKGPLTEQCLRAIYREVMSGSLALEMPITIAYLGPSGTFSQQAARMKFGDSVAYLPVDTIEDVFAAVTKGTAGYGVVPIENSTGGGITDTLDMFMESECKVCAEIVLHIGHNLLAKSSLEEVTRVYSKPQVFTQCQRWLRTHLPNAELHQALSTAEAAQRAASEGGAAAIASKEAAREYGLKIVTPDIQDAHRNVTRFFVLGQNYAKPSGNDRTSLMFSVRDEAGALCDMLVPFKIHNINLTRIESRPSRRAIWDYYFFVDLEGHSDDTHVRAALGELRKKCATLKILGSFPVSTS